MGNNQNYRINCTDVTWEGRSDCARCTIRNRVLFGEVPEQDLQQLLLPINHYHYKAHTPLYRPDSEERSLYTIRRGLVKLVQYLPNGSQRIVRLLRSGDLAGLEITVGQHYHHAAIAVTEVSACRIPLDVVTALEALHPELTQELMRRWQRSLDEADLVITELSTGSAAARIARLLLHMSQPGEPIPCGALSREEMAAIVGITTETTSRIMAEFKRHGVVHQGATDHCEYDLPRLKEIARDD